MRAYPRTSQEWTDANHERLAHLRRNADLARIAVESTIGRASSKDGAVSVAVDSSGDVVSLQISDAALRHGGAHLAQSIVTTMRQARKAGLEAVRDSLAELENSPAGADVLAALGLTAPSPTNFPSDVAGDNWSEKSVLHRA